MNCSEIQLCQHIEKSISALHSFQKGVCNPDSQNLENVREVEKSRNYFQRTICLQRSTWKHTASSFHCVHCVPSLMHKSGEVLFMMFPFRSRGFPQHDSMGILYRM